MAGLLQRYACRMGSARAVGCCESGAMLIEFALIFPILLVLFLGTIEFGDALTVNRKLTNAASAVSDLVAQVAEISAPELTDIARAAEEIVKPYASAQMTMVVTSVETDGSGATTVGWSFAQGSGAVARQTGESFGTLPS
jgi:Flp pilus assembly protein TadG